MSKEEEGLDGRIDLSSVTAGLIKDLKDLRAGRITNSDARVRAQLGREILRSVYLQIEGAARLPGPNRTDRNTIEGTVHGDSKVRD